MGIMGGMGIVGIVGGMGSGVEVLDRCAVGRTEWEAANPLASQQNCLRRLGVCHTTGCGRSMISLRRGR